MEILGFNKTTLLDYPGQLAKRSAGAASEGAADDSRIYP